MSTISNILAQQKNNDSTKSKTLNEVIITGNRFLNFSTGTNIKKTDSSILQINRNNFITDILQQQSLISIKSYGGGSLANASVRGSGPEHTAILWNGFNLQSSMNGQSDIALLPALFADELYVQYGGSGAVWGSGVVGGALVLNNSCKFNDGTKIQVNSSAGSYHSQQQSLQLSYSNSSLTTSTRVFYHTAENDFSFQNYTITGNPEEKQKHASVLQYGILHENYFRLSPNQKLSVRLWYQFNDRNIPPTVYQTESDSRQTDRTCRVTADWQRTGKSLGIVLRSAYFNDNILYQDKLFGIHAVSKANTWITETETKISLPYRQLVNIGLNNTYQKADVDDYIRNPEREKFALFMCYKISNNKQNINAMISARQEFTKGINIPFIPSAGIDLRFLKVFKLKAGVTRNFRLPTFNELYWNPGGNVNLEPEKGWSEDMALSVEYTKRIFSFESEISVFNRNMKNWVIWLPENNYWSPKNLQEVWSRGLEWTVGANIIKNEWKISAQANGNYILTTNEKSKKEGDESIGKQLMYVPKINLFFNFTLGFHGLYVNYNHTYSGCRYISSDNSSFLDPYQTGNISFSGTVPVKPSLLRITLQFYNIWNEIYEVVPTRPMPGRNFRINITLEFNKPPKKNNYHHEKKQQPV